LRITAELFMSPDHCLQIKRRRWWWWWRWCWSFVINCIHKTQTWHKMRNETVLFYFTF